MKKDFKTEINETMVSTKRKNYTVVSKALIAVNQGLYSFEDLLSTIDLRVLASSLGGAPPVSGAVSGRSGRSKGGGE